MTDGQPASAKLLAPLVQSWAASSKAKSLLSELVSRWPHGGVLSPTPPQPSKPLLVTLAGRFLNQPLSEVFLPLSALVGTDAEDKKGESRLTGGKAPSRAGVTVLSLQFPGPQRVPSLGFSAIQSGWWDCDITREGQPGTLEQERSPLVTAFCTWFQSS